MRRLLWGGLLVVSLSLGSMAAETNLLAQATVAWKAGDFTNALVLADRAVAKAPKDVRPLNFRAQMRALLGQRSEGIADLTAALVIDPKSPWLFHERAEHYFRAGAFSEACADFAKADELSPERAAQDWQRGIALYYAGLYKEGRKLFEFHRTVNPEDVENAAWHFLCVARLEGVEKARAALISVAADGRVPMREVQGLFAGKGTEAEVFQAAEQGVFDALPAQRFYAYLYVGLFHEAAGEPNLAERNLRQAAGLAKYGGYMGEVARVHVERFNQAAAQGLKPAILKP